MDVDAGIKVETTSKVCDSQCNSISINAINKSTHNLNRNLEAEARFLESKYNNVMGGSFKVADDPTSSM